jgi:hypothetical protein
MDRSVLVGVRNAICQHGSLGYISAKGIGNDCVYDNVAHTANGRFATNTYSSWLATWSGGSNGAQYSMYIKVTPN